MNEFTVKPNKSVKEIVELNRATSGYAPRSTEEILRGMRDHGYDNCAIPGVGTFHLIESDWIMKFNAEGLPA